MTKVDRIERVRDVLVVVFWLCVAVGFGLVIESELSRRVAGAASNVSKVPPWADVLMPANAIGIYVLTVMVWAMARPSSLQRQFAREIVLRGSAAGAGLAVVVACLALVVALIKAVTEKGLAGAAHVTAGWSAGALVGGVLHFAEFVLFLSLFFTAFAALIYVARKYAIQWAWLRRLLANGTGLVVGALVAMLSLFLLDKGETERWFGWPTWLPGSWRLWAMLGVSALAGAVTFVVARRRALVKLACWPSDDGKLFSVAGTEGSPGHYVSDDKIYRWVDLQPTGRLGVDKARSSLLKTLIGFLLAGGAIGYSLDGVRGALFGALVLGGYGGRGLAEGFRQRDADARRFDEDHASEQVWRQAAIEHCNGSYRFVLRASRQEHSEGQIECDEPWEAVTRFAQKRYWETFGSTEAISGGRDWNVVVMFPERGAPWKVASTTAPSATVYQLVTELNARFDTDARKRFMEKLATEELQRAARRASPSAAGSDGGDVPATLP